MENIAQTFLFEKAQQCIKDKNQLMYFGASMTEQEIKLGFFDVNDAIDHTLVCLRDNGTRPKDYLDAKNLNERITYEQPRYLINYSEPNQQFAQEVKEALFEIIADRIANVKEEASAIDKKRKEIEEDLANAETSYIDLLGNLARLEKAVNENPGKTIVVCGESGTGKTMLLKTYAHRNKSVFVFTDLLRETYDLSLIALTITGIERHPIESPKQHLERALRSFENDTVVVIDSFDEIDNAEDLYRLAVPDNVTIVIGAIEDPGNCVSFPLVAMDMADAKKMIDNLLKRKGRTLQEEQWKMAVDSLPEKTTALYLFELSETLAGKTSEDTLEQKAFKTTQDMIKDIYDQRKHDYGVVFVAQAYAAIAASHRGLLENELIDILAQDNQISNEVEKLNKAHHHTSADNQLPVANLWSSLLSASSDFLVTITENERPLLRFRHNIMKKIATTNDKTMVANMLGYFDRLPFGNPRRIDEMLGLCQALDESLAGKYLSCPDVQAEWIKDGKLAQLLHEMDKHGVDTTIAAGHDFLYRLAGNAYPHVFNRHSKNQYLLFDAPYLATVDKTPESDELRILPIEREVALRSDRLIATATNETLAIHDYDKRITTDRRHIAPSRNIVLYWNKNDLVLRENDCRTTFTIDNGKFVNFVKQACPPLDDLFEDNGYMKKADGFMETDYAAPIFANNITYHVGDEAKTKSLYYIGHETCTWVWQNMAAILVDGKMVHIANLEEDKIYMELRFPNVRNICFSNDGKLLLVALNDGRSGIYEITNVLNMPMVAPPGKSWRHKERNEAIKKTLVDTLSTLCLMFAGHDVLNQYCTFNMRSIANRPLFTCYEAKRDVYACYYNNAGIAFIRLFDNATNRQLLEAIVEPICREDLSGDPFYFADGHLVVQGRSKAQMLNIKTCSWRIEQAKQEDYTAFRARQEAPLPPRHLSKAAIGFWQTVLFSCRKMFNAGIVATSMAKCEHVIKKKTERYTFIANIDHRTIHVIQDNDNVPIINDQLEYPFLAIDVLNDDLIVFFDYGKRPIRYQVEYN